MFSPVFSPGENVGSSPNSGWIPSLGFVWTTETRYFRIHWRFAHAPRHVLRARLHGEFLARAELRFWLYDETRPGLRFKPLRGRFYNHNKQHGAYKALTFENKSFGSFPLGATSSTKPSQKDENLVLEVAPSGKEPKLLFSKSLVLSHLGLLLALNFHLFGMVLVHQMTECKRNLTLAAHISARKSYIYRKQRWYHCSGEILSNLLYYFLNPSIAFLDEILVNFSLLFDRLFLPDQLPYKSGVGVMNGGPKKPGGGGFS